VARSETGHSQYNISLVNVDLDVALYMKMCHVWLLISLAILFC
jgi:hypothetical protein